MSTFISRSVEHEISNSKQRAYSSRSEHRRRRRRRPAHFDRFPGRTRSMPPRRAMLVVTAAAAAVLLLLLVVNPHAAAQMTLVDPDSWASDHGVACTGTVEECVAGGVAASTRRELGRGGHISYDAMSRGRVPCSIRGASYYNCRPGAPANPYSRGCSAITRCRG